MTEYARPQFPVKSTTTIAIHIALLRQVPSAEPDAKTSTVTRLRPRRLGDPASKRRASTVYLINQAPRNHAAQVRRDRDSGADFPFFIIFFYFQDNMRRRRIVGEAPLTRVKDCMRNELCKYSVGPWMMRWDARTVSTCFERSAGTVDVQRCASVAPLRQAYEYNERMLLHMFRIAYPRRSQNRRRSKSRLMDHGATPCFVPKVHQR